jgi:hypothetical protein
MWPGICRAGAGDAEGRNGEIVHGRSLPLEIFAFALPYYMAIGHARPTWRAVLPFGSPRGDHFVIEISTTNRLRYDKSISARKVMHEGAAGNACHACNFTHFYIWLAFSGCRAGETMRMSADDFVPQATTETDRSSVLRPKTSTTTASMPSASSLSFPSVVRVVPLTS